MKASMHASGALLVLLLGIISCGGCEKSPEGPAASAGDPDPVPSPAAAAAEHDARPDGGERQRADGGPRERTASPLPFIGSALDQTAIAAELRSARPRVFKPVGTASVVFQMRLEGPVQATFEPRTTAHPERYRHEVAAYRIARLLRLDNVPPAVVRRLDRDQLRRRLHPDYRQVWDDIVRWTDWDDDGTVPGAAVLWSPQLRSLPLASERWMKRWLRWLDQESSVPADERRLAADLSTMVAFDYLIGHWKRFEDERLQGPPTGRRVYIRNNDSAFATPIPKHAHEDAITRVQRVQRFSRSFVDALMDLDERRLRRELAETSAGERDTPLLTDAEIDAVLQRRRTILSLLGALVHTYGEPRILSLP